MVTRLTSVRIDEEALSFLQALATINRNAVAHQVRRAITELIEREVLADEPNFKARLAAALQEQEQIVDEMLKRLIPPQE